MRALRFHKKESIDSVVHDAVDGFSFRGGGRVELGDALFIYMEWKENERSADSFLRERFHPCFI